MSFLSRVKSIFSSHIPAPNEYAENPSFLAKTPGNGCCLRPSTGQVLFLDLDGVMHPYEHGSLVHLPAFEKMMQRHPHIDIVISSDWRLTTDVGGLISMFSCDFQHRILGATPDLGTTLRHPEVIRFASEHGVDNWIAVDDRSDLFPPDCEYLFHVDRSVGLNHPAMSALNHRLSTQFTR